MRIIYNLTTNFCKITLWKERMKSTNEYRSFQQYCLKQKYKSRFIDSRKYQKELNNPFSNLKSVANYRNLNQLCKYLPDRSKKIKEQTTMTYYTKLKKLNKGSVGQRYESLKTKLVHSISSYTPTPADERVLRRGWDFYIENKVTNFIDLKN